MSPTMTKKRKIRAYSATRPSRLVCLSKRRGGIVPPCSSIMVLLETVVGVAVCWP